MLQKDIQLGTRCRVVSSGKIVDVVVTAKLRKVRGQEQLPYGRALYQVARVPEASLKPLAYLPGLRTSAALHGPDWTGGFAPAGYQFKARPNWDGKGENHDGADATAPTDRAPRDRDSIPDSAPCAPDSDRPEPAAGSDFLANIRAKAAARMAAEKAGQ